MNFQTLSKIFEERSGFVYTYVGESTSDIEITVELFASLKTENFISKVINYQNSILVYSNLKIPPGDNNFNFLLSLEPPQYAPIVQQPVDESDQSNEE